VLLQQGAYIHQPGPKQWAAVKRLVLEHRCRVVFPIYPKGPKYNYKQAYPPMIRLLEKVAAEAREEGKRYLLMGDSAGGGFAIGLAIALRDQNKAEAMPAQLVLSSPWTDLALDNPDLVDQNSKVR
jgi:acetyl esterase/lipase